MEISGRTVARMLGILAVVLIVIPLLGMIGMMSMGGPMMGVNIGGTTGMHTAGLLWMVLAVVVVIALVVVLFRATTNS